MSLFVLGIDEALSIGFGMSLCFMFLIVALFKDQQLMLSIVALDWIIYGSLLKDGFCNFAFGSAQNDRVVGITRRVNVFIFD